MLYHYWVMTWVFLSRPGFAMILELAVLLSTVGRQDVPQGRLIEDRRWGGTDEDTVFASHIFGFALKGAKAVITMPMIGRVLRIDLTSGSITPVGRPGKGSSDTICRCPAALGSTRRSRGATP